jgi:hypothetical protein
MRSLLSREGPLHWTMKMFGLVESGYFAQTGALGFQTLFDFGIVFNLDEIRRHIFLRQWTVTGSWCAVWWFEDSFGSVRVGCKGRRRRHSEEQFSRELQICY